MNVTKEIVARYSRAGFQEAGSPTPKILRFNNSFSIHFIFLLDSWSDLKESWMRIHEYLKEDYRTFSGPRDMEWNYYAVFLVTEIFENDEELNSIRSGIQADTSYSRKYVLTIDNMDELPPGMISSKQLGRKGIAPENMIKQWEEMLGPELFNLLLLGPKSTIEKRLFNYIEKKVDER